MLCGGAISSRKYNNISGENLFMFDITNSQNFAVICNSNNNENNKLNKKLKIKINKNCFMNT